MTRQTDRPRLAVLISGSGRTLVNLHERILDGSLYATLDRVVSSKSEVLGVSRARELGLRVEIVERRRFPIVRNSGAIEQTQTGGSTRRRPDPLGQDPRQVDPFQEALTRAVGDVDLVCMAGFLSLWRIPESYLGRVINIHPALLPEFGGRGMFGHHVHEAVLAAGRTESGCTVHYCDNEYDHGPIILQRRVPVLPDDTPATLAERVFAEECIAYPEAIRRVMATFGAS